MVFAGCRDPGHAKALTLNMLDTKYKRSIEAASMRVQLCRWYEATAPIQENLKLLPGVLGTVPSRHTLPSSALLVPLVLASALGASAPGAKDTGTTKSLACCERVARLRRSANQSPHIASRFE